MLNEIKDFLIQIEDIKTWVLFIYFVVFFVCIGYEIRTNEALIQSMVCIETNQILPEFQEQETKILYDGKIKEVNFCKTESLISFKNIKKYGDTLFNLSMLFILSIYLPKIMRFIKWLQAQE
jgi:hypothetical protein